MRFLAAILLLSISSSFAAELYPTSLRGGLPGNLFTNAGANLGAGIPNRTTIFATHNPGDSAATINSSIGSCPSNQVVFLNAGTYDFSGGRIEIESGDDGVTVRGTTNAAGYPTTLFQNCTMRVGSDLGPAEDWATEVTAINITAGLSEGSTTITLASAPGTDFAVGDVFFIDQTDDGTTVKDGGVEFAHRPGRAYQHMLHIVSKSGNDITFEPPLLGRHWSVASRDPEAVGFSVKVGGTVRNSGFENIDFDQGSAGGLYGLVIGRAYSCWAKNIRYTGWTTSGGAAGIRTMFDVSSTVTECIAYDGPTASSSSYAIYPSPSSYGLIIHNAMTNVGLGIPMISGVGMVIAYNVGVPPYPYSPDSFLAEFFFPHGGHSHHCLYEGNWVPNIYLDAIFGGNNSAIGIVGNRLPGAGTTESGNLTPITLEVDMDDIVIIGNTLGVNGTQSVYTDGTVGAGGSGILDIDSSAAGEIIRNNYDTVNDGFQSGTEIGSDTMRDSYIYSSKPDFFGDRPWPPYPPTLASAGATTYTNIPAGYRLIYGEWPPSESEGGGSSGASDVNVTELRIGTIQVAP